MKTPALQIYAMLQAYRQEDVIYAIDLYNDMIQAAAEKRIDDAKNQLLASGWTPQKEKPSNKEFYRIGNEFWVQSDEAKTAQLKHLQETSIKRQSKKMKSIKRQNMELKQAPVICPKCNAKMYKQNICSGCAAGKAGYKIRLICENDPDHEVLL